MITVATLLWESNRHSRDFSSMYSEAWVEKLYRGFARNLTQPFRFVCYTDRPRTFREPIVQARIASAEPSYADCIQPYEMGEPMILVGLDTVICGNIDHLADYCLTGDVIALPVDPYAKGRGGERIACNGVALVPAGHEHVFTAWNGENDMDWMRRNEHVFIDDIWPGEVVSYKANVRKNGLGAARICYFHGQEKPHQLAAGNPILEHWI